MMIKKMTVAAILLLASSQFTLAAMAPNLSDYDTSGLYQKINKWIEQEIVTVSIEAQNDRYGTLSEKEIIALDDKWRNEHKQTDKPLIAATLSSPLSVYLTRMQGQSYGLFVEVFVMDNKGLNVGQSSVTSDFWQGDEAKFQKTFDVGANTIFVDEPEWDEDLKIWRVQVNKSLVNPDTKSLIGAVTVEVNLTELARRQEAANN